METLLYILARTAIGLVQMLPLKGAARLGRLGGAIAYWLDTRHRKVAVENLSMAFPEKSPAEVLSISKENFKRIGENFASAAKTAAMTGDEIGTILSVTGLEKLADKAGAQNRSFVFAIGHFGNFEIYARCSRLLPGFQFATTFRSLHQPSLNRLLQSLREKSGCLFFDRQTDAEALRAAMNRGGLVLGLLADQHSGSKGARIPFFGREAFTNTAAAVLALRYHAPLFTAICYRTDLGRWRIEIGDQISTIAGGHPRPVAEIMLDVNRVFEAAIRRDPPNWFWVHQRWKEPRWKIRGFSSPDEPQRADTSTATQKS